MYLAVTPQGRRVNTKEIALAYGISLHHLQKAVLGLAELGYLETVPGRGGGIRLARSASQIKLGDLIASTEKVGNLVECGRNICPLEGRCLLKGFLDKAERLLIYEHNKVTIIDIVKHPTAPILAELLSQST
jgi:Rrf2 family nitric oxide-sensitive transcriptional repressor